MANYHNQRIEYGKFRLEKSKLTPDPFALFKTWFQEALKANIPDANAMVVSTCLNNAPSSRITLLKEISEGGFVFYTNYNSRKGYEIAQNPKVSLLFFWQSLERQVRVEGSATKVKESESETYFNSRPAESRIAAIVSPQSKIIAHKETLLKEYQELLAQNKPLNRPDHWGGYRVIPHYFEYWQGGENRLHDRFSYLLEGDSWNIQQLAP